jgi:serine/threonine-protein kinase
VLELVEGPTLAERIGSAPITVNEGLTIARQIAEGLEAAHARGIVHRDLKPTNIKLRHDGRVQILDFGLAKAIGPLDASAVSSDVDRSAVTARSGVIIGTAAYMSPEQARGQVADKRADIWAFGCVLYSRQAHGHLGVRLRPVRGADRPANLQRGDRPRHSGRSPERRARLERSAQ